MFRVVLVEKDYHPDMHPNIPISVQAVVATADVVDKESASKVDKVATAVDLEISLSLWAVVEVASVKVAVATRTIRLFPLRVSSRA